MLSCHFQLQLHWHAVPPASLPHRLHPRIMRVKVKELLKSCIGTKEEERARVQLSTSAKESKTTKSSKREHQSQCVDAEEKTETVEGSEEAQSV